MKKTNLINIIRWIGFIPASIIAPIFTGIVMAILLLLGDILSGNLWMYLRNPNLIVFDHFFTSFIICGALGYVFITAGVTVVPKFKRIVAFILFGIIAISLGFLLITSLIMTNFADSWRFILNIVVFLLFAGIAAFMTEDEEEQSSELSKITR